MTEAVLTLADLESWSHPGTALAVLGHPIAHSLSPRMHNAALADLARGAARYGDWRYFRFDVDPAELPRALELLHARRFRGVNLTLPHKVLALDCVAQIDPAARTAGAVNTLAWSEGGWHGWNTDGYGLSAALQQTLGRSLAGAQVALLGAGGAARGAAVECLRRGCAGLWVVNRTQPNLDALLAVLAPLAGTIPIEGHVLTPDIGTNVRSQDVTLLNLPAEALVINATSAGLHAGDSAPIDLSLMKRPSGVFDMIYNPPSTRLLGQAQALGIPCANGLAMLVHQGAKSLEIWTGVPADRTAPAMGAALDGTNDSEFA